MRIFLKVLILLLILQTLTKANDIRDFEIEGMSIGDSLLDHFSKNKIKDSIVYGPYDHIKKNPRKFYQAEISLKDSIFSKLIVGLKKNDETYKIYMLKGALIFKDDIQACYEKQKEINSQVEALFSNLQKDEFIKSFEHDLDSKVKSITYWFKNGGYADVDCYDWSVKSGYVDHLRTGVSSKEFNDWLNEI
tara:strand:- start:318 stop:890 length:573 start_codon:yes stop_codon:yes gene_type:complete